MKTSIRRKIVWAFSILIFFGGSIWLVNDYIHRLIRVKTQIIFHKNKALNTILEVRRYEKNFFLNGRIENLKQAIKYNCQAEEELSDIIANYGKYTLSKNLDETQERLGSYCEIITALMNRINASGASPLYPSDPETEKLKGEIAESGHALTTHFEQMVLQEQEGLDDLVKRSRRYILFFSLTVFMLCIGVAVFLLFNVNRPLKAIEGAIVKIASGDYSYIDLKCTSYEFQSLVNSLNKMINELNRRNEQIVHSEKMASLGTLTSGVAHELNNPLNNISTSIQIVMEELEDDDIEYRRQLLYEAEKQVERARDIVKALLEFSGKRSFSPRRVCFKDLVSDSITLIKGEVPANVTITLDIPDDLEVDLDASRIQQILINLMLNGIHAMEKEGGELYVKAYIEDESTFCFQVRDTGVGIPMENIYKIFDPFFTTKEVGKGSGLGLAVSRSIVENHGGTMEAYSRYGEGATFVVRLPARTG
ncbi:MAG: HAMP domain-containing histidine kinase [Deltaproteobacteria bacterium]|nr:HAMP domain-containing histidine kinase [Deltaproteobacteria bacterium]